MGFLEDGQEFIDFDLGVIVVFEVKHLLDLRNDLSLHFVVDQLIKGNILVLGYPIQHFKNLIENGELLLLGFFLQPLEELLLAEIKQLRLCLGHFITSCIDVGDDLMGVEAHGECLLVEV